MIKGEELHLRTLEPEDIDFLVVIENDPDHWKVSGTLVPFSRKILQDYIDSAQDLFTHRQVRFVIENNNNQLLGIIDLFDYDPFHLRAGVGILIASNERRKGYAEEALNLLIEYAENILRLKNLHCQINSDNSSSIELFQKCGFGKAGIWKDWINEGEQWGDVLLYQKKLS